jgi:hydroxymethylbilane synthase
LRPDGRRAVVVGGGLVAARKAEALAAAGFPLFVVATSLGDTIRSVLELQAGEAAERRYETSDLADAALVIAATNDDETNARVVADARAAGVLACDASDPHRGDFHMPATVRLGDLTIGVDSLGGAPAFSRRVADEIALQLGPQYGEAARTLARLRTYVKTVLPAGERSAALKALSTLPVSRLAAMNPAQAEHEADAVIERLRSPDGEGVASPTASVICASRASALAILQTREIAARLAERGVSTTVLTITTTGDRDLTRPIDRLGSVNVFVGELETALREGRADYAVHSCKDLPSELAADMRLAAISLREDPRDAFCSERYPTFEALPPGAVVGTSSPRRRLQLTALRPDLIYEEIRGNIDTRLRKLREGRYDAIVLAMAGLNRLRLRATHTVAFAVDSIVPAVGQGALAVETRADNAPLAAVLRAAVNDAVAERCIACERAALRALRAGCSAPIGVYANAREGVLSAIGAHVLSDGSVLRARIERPVAQLDEAAALGTELAAQLDSKQRPLVVLARTRPGPSAIAEGLRADGVQVIELRAGDDGPDPAERTPDMLVFASSGSVAAVRPYLARLHGARCHPAVVAMGPQSSRAAAEAGFQPDAVSEERSIEALGALIRARLARWQ